MSGEDMLIDVGWTWLIPLMAMVFLMVVVPLIVAMVLLEPRDSKESRGLLGNNRNLLKRMRREDRELLRRIRRDNRELLGCDRCLLERIRRENRGLMERIRQENRELLGSDRYLMERD